MRSYSGSRASGLANDPAYIWSVAGCRYLFSRQWRVARTWGYTLSLGQTLVICTMVLFFSSERSLDSFASQLTSANSHNFCRYSQCFNADSVEHMLIIIALLLARLHFLRWQSAHRHSSRMDGHRHSPLSSHVCSQMESHFHPHRCISREATSIPPLVRLDHV